MTKILNLEDLSPPEGEPEYIIVIKGVEHPMKPAELGDMIYMMREIEALAAAPSMAAELDLTVKAIIHFFPTLTAAEIYTWSPEAVEKLFNVVRGFNMDGSVKETADASGKQTPAS